MGLGSIAVSPLDMASAYATLAAGGVYSEPIAIRKVVLPNGKEDTDARLGQPKRNARDLRRGRLEGDPDPRGQRQLRHRHAGGVRPPRRRQDGHDRQARRRVVRRLHARISRRPSGWATRPARSRWRTSTGSPSPGGSFPAEIWRLTDGAHDRVAPARGSSPTRGPIRSTSRSSAARSRSATTRTTSRRRRRPIPRRPALDRTTRPRTTDAGEPKADAARPRKTTKQAVRRWPAVTAGAATLVLVAAACALAWRPDSPLVPRRRRSRLGDGAAVSRASRGGSGRVSARARSRSGALLRRRGSRSRSPPRSSSSRSQRRCFSRPTPGRTGRTAGSQPAVTGIRTRIRPSRFPRIRRCRSWGARGSTRRPSTDPPSRSRPSPWP